MKSTNFLFSIIRLCIFGIIFLVPIFFLPFTFEYLEFNKQYILGFLVLVGVLSWIGKAVVEKEIKFFKTPLDIPLVVFWFIILVSGIFSQDRGLSFFGAFDGLTVGVVPLTFYILFYFLVTNNLVKPGDIKKVSILVLTSSLFSFTFFFLSVSGLLSKFGLQWKFFNTVSLLNTPFGVFSAVCLALSLNALFARKNIKSDIFWFISFISSLAVIFLVGFKLVWLAVVVALFLLLVLGMSRLEEIRTSWVTVSFAILVLALIFVILGTPQFLIAELPMEASLSQNISWKIATDTLGSSLKQFILGSGPATFFYDFIKFRPESLNLTFAWNLRFNSPASTFLNIISMLGFLGTVSYILVLLLTIGTIIFIWAKKSFKKGSTLSAAIKNSREHDSSPSLPLLFFGLAVAWMSLLVATFFIVFSTTLWVLFFLFMGCLMIVTRQILHTEERPITISLKTSPQYALASSFIFILVFSGVIIFGIFLGRFYIANIYYAKSVKQAEAGDVERMVETAKLAVNYNPTSAIYHLLLARSYLLRASIESGKSESNAEMIASFVAMGVNEARSATNLTPYNVQTWEMLATMYENANIIAPNAIDWAIASLDKAIELEKTNPLHFLRRGNLKFLVQKYDDAKNDYEEAVRLKANFVDAFFRLAILEETRKNLDAAIMRMGDAFRFSPQDPDILFQLGRLLYNRRTNNDLSLAEQAFRAAIQYNPNHANSLFGLASLLEQRGERREALGFFQKILQLNPDNSEIQTKVRSLKAYLGVD